MATKTILYTKKFDAVKNQSSDSKFQCIVSENDECFKLGKGARIVTNKGNILEVLDITDGINTYPDVKSSSITGIAEVTYPNNNAPKINSVSNISAKMKSMMLPTEVHNVRIATDGKICVATKEGYVTIDDNNNLISYPDELTLDIPMFVMPKPKDKLAVGDIIALPNSYAKVTSIKEGKINCISYSGSGKIVYPIKDFLLGQSVVKVVVSIFNGQTIDPMMLLMLSKDNNDSILPLMLMMNKGDMKNINPLMLLALTDKKDSNIKDLLMLSMFTGNNPFNGFNKAE